jgi:hypothetical protein
LPRRQSGRAERRGPGDRLSQRLPHFGTSYAAGWDTTRSTSTSQFSNYNPILTSRVQFTVSQPLIKDLTIDAGRQQLIVSKRNREISDTRFRETVVRTLSDVKKAYWDSWRRRRWSSTTAVAGAARDWCGSTRHGSTPARPPRTW